MGKAIPIKPGDKFGHLTVVERAGVYEKSGAVLWRCRCDCGREKIAPGYRLKSGYYTKCASWNHEILGKRFGHLIVIDYDHTEKQEGYFRCRCDCGNETVVLASNLPTGHTTSCGCRKLEASLTNISEMREHDLVDGTHLGLLNNRLPKNNSSGIKGVYWCNSSQKWCAHMGFRNRKYWLGDYDNIEDAAEARLEAEELIFDPVLKKHGRELTSEDEYQQQLQDAVKRLREEMRSKTDFRD